MAKDFTKWHKLKTRLDNRKEFSTFSEGEVWWCSIGINIGAEEEGNNQYRYIVTIKNTKRKAAAETHRKN